MNEDIKSIPLETAIEHYAAGMQRGEVAGQHDAYKKIVALLKEHGHYDAVLTLKKYERKTSHWNFQTVI